MTPTHRSDPMTDTLRDAIAAMQADDAPTERECGYQDAIDEVLRILDARAALAALAAAPQPVPELHPDDAAVDRFAAAMKVKLAAARAKGRSGWDDPDQCSVETLADLLLGHVGKGNSGTFEDIANFAMMLHQRGADPAILTAPQPTPAGADERDEIERIICDAFTCDLQGRGDEDGAFWQTAADALLAAGWTRGGDAAGLREALSPEDREWINNRADELFRQSERQRGGVRPATITPMDYRDYFVIDATAERIAALARLSAPVVCHKTASGDTQAPLPVTDDAQADPETLAWAVEVDGDVVWVDAGMGQKRDVAEIVAEGEGGKPVRVAIRVVEDGV